MERFEMRVSEEFLARIDAARGGLPRATWIKQTLEKALAGAESVDASRERSSGSDRPVGSSAPASASPRASKDERLKRAQNVEASPPPKIAPRHWA